MAEERTADQLERQALRRQLRQAGWTVGETERSKGGPMRLALWPAPHTGPAEGIEPRWVEGTNKTDVLRNAVRDLAAQPSPEEP
jgi:hypothetical protein